MEIIVPIGISGSGKSTTYNEKFSGYKIICPDNIRLELTGNISDQSKNKEVFDRVDALVRFYIQEDINFYYDATNVNTKYRKEFVKKVKDLNPNARVIYVYFPANIMESYKRIQKDLKDKKVRSNVPLDVLYRQYNMYRASLDSDWKEEGADYAILIKDEELMKNYIDKIDLTKYNIYE